MVYVRGEAYLPQQEPFSGTTQYVGVITHISRTPEPGGYLAPGRFTATPTIKCFVALSEPRDSPFIIESANPYQEGSQTLRLSALSTITRLRS